MKRKGNAQVKEPASIDKKVKSEQTESFEKPTKVEKSEKLEKPDENDDFDEERLSRTLFVGNVSQDVKPQKLQRLFKRFGGVESVRIRNIISSNSKVSKRISVLSKKTANFVDTVNAYVVFKPTESIADVLRNACKELHLSLFKEKHIRVLPAAKTKVGNKRHSAFIGNIPFDCTEEEMIATFAPIARQLDVCMLNVRLNRDKDTGVGRGIGYVTLDDELGVQSLINMSGEVKIRKNSLRISKAAKESNRNSKTYKRAMRKDRLEKKIKKKGGERGKWPKNIANWRKK